VVSKSRTRRKRTPPEEPPPKLINFGGGSSGGVLFLRVLDLETTQQRKPLGGGVLLIKLDKLILKELMANKTQDRHKHYFLFCNILCT